MEEPIIEVVYKKNKKQKIFQFILPVLGEVFQIDSPFLFGYVFLLFLLF